MNHVGFLVSRVLLGYWSVLIEPERMKCLDQLMRVDLVLSIDVMPLMTTRLHFSRAHFE